MDDTGDDDTTEVMANLKPKQAKMIRTHLGISVSQKYNIKDDFKHSNFKVRSVLCEKIPSPP